MLISFFSFGISWVVYALVFYGISALLPQFHSLYFQTVFQIGLGIGFADALMLRLVRIANFHVHWVVLLLVTVLVNWGLIVLTNNPAGGDYYITGRATPLIASAILSVVVVGFDFLKNRLLSDVRL